MAEPLDGLFGFSLLPEFVIELGHQTQRLLPGVGSLLHARLSSVGWQDDRQPGPDGVCYIVTHNGCYTFNTRH